MSDKLTQAAPLEISRALSIAVLLLLLPVPTCAQDNVVLSAYRKAPCLFKVFMCILERVYRTVWLSYSILKYDR